MKKLGVTFSGHLSSMSRSSRSAVPRLELKLFMKQLVVAVQLEANIIGKQLWIGFFLGGPGRERGLAREATTLCHSPSNVSRRIGRGPSPPHDSDTGMLPGGRRVAEPPLIISRATSQN